MGKAEGQVCSKEGRGAGEQSHCPKADEPCSAEQVVGARKSAMGSGEEGWSYGAVES